MCPRDPRQQSMWDCKTAHGVVAYVDVLAFKDLDCDACARVLQKLWESVQYPEHPLSPIVHAFADSCIIAFPTRRGSTDGLPGIKSAASQMIRVQRSLLPERVLLRGGIAGGEYWPITTPHGTEILGPAANRAHELEKWFDPLPCITAESAELPTGDAPPVDAWSVRPGYGYCNYLCGPPMPVPAGNFDAEWDEQLARLNDSRETLLGLARSAHDMPEGEVKNRRLEIVERATEYHNKSVRADTKRLRDTLALGWQNTYSQKLSNFISRLHPLVIDTADRPLPLDSTPGPA